MRLVQPLHQNQIEKLSDLENSSNEKVKLVLKANLKDYFPAVTERRIDNIFSQILFNIGINENQLGNLDIAQKVKEAIEKLLNSLNLNRKANFNELEKISKEKTKELLKAKVKEQFPEAPTKRINNIFSQVLFNSGINEERIDNGEIAQQAVEAIKKVHDLVICQGSIPEIYSEGLIKGDDARNLVKFLLMDAPWDARYLSSRALLALKWKKDRAFQNEVICELQLVGEILYNMYRAGTTSEEQKKIIELTLDHLLTLYPFFEPDEGRIINHPRLVDGVIQMISYRIQCLQLTPDWLGAPVFAYGFIPFSDTIPSILNFMGTPPYTTSGCRIAMWADFIPFMSAGEVIYQMGEKVIQNFIDERWVATGLPVDATGFSLGAGLSMQAAIHNIGKVNAIALNPPLFLDNLDEICNENVKKEGIYPNIRILAHKNDPIIVSGKIPLGATVNRVFPDEEQQDSYIAHLKLLDGGKNIVVIKSCREQENNSESRKIWTLVYKLVCFPFFMISSIALIISGIILYLSPKLNVFSSHHRSN